MLVLLVAAQMWVTAFSGDHPTADDWDRAAREIRRIPAAELQMLPDQLRKNLPNCSVPQAWDTKEPHNVIRGSLLGADAWALLCSRNGSSMILVGTDPMAMMSFAPAKEAIYLQVVGEKMIGYSRKLRVISRDEIIEHCKSAEKPCPKIEHEGIEDIFLDKASRIHYFTSEGWVEIAGSD